MVFREALLMGIIGTILGSSWECSRPTTLWVRWLAVSAKLPPINFYERLSFSEPGERFRLSDRFVFFKTHS
jgi:hypothetical protein